MQDTYNLLVES